MKTPPDTNPLADRRAFVTTLAAGVAMPLFWPRNAASEQATTIDIVTLNTEDFSRPIEDWSWKTPGTSQPASAWSRAISRAGLSPTTGPNGGAEPKSRAVVNGNPYAYTEASDPRSTTWTIESPEFDAALGKITLTFDFHMRFGRTGGQSDGTFSVQAWNGSAWFTIGNPIVGSQHSNASAPYLSSTSFGAYDSSGFRNPDFKFRFRFTEGAGGGTYPYDCALDNINVIGPKRATTPPDLPRPRGIIQGFRGEDGVNNFPGPLNFPVPERAHNRQTITRPASLVPFGSASIKIEIRPGDPQWNNDAAIRPRSVKRRAEFSWRPFRFAPGEDGWVGAAFYLPSNPMAAVRGCTIFQLHNSPDPGEFMQIYCFDGRLRIDNQSPDGTVSVLNTNLSPFLNKWVRMVVNFKPSTGRNGFLNIWFDDVLTVNRTGPNKPRGRLGPYFKHGTYFWGYGKFDSNRRAVCYYDNLRIGDKTSNYQSVNPTNFV